MSSVSQRQGELQFAALHWEESCTSYGKTQPVAMAGSSSSPSLYFVQRTRVFLGLMPCLKVFLKSLSFSGPEVITDLSWVVSPVGSTVDKVVTKPSRLQGQKPAMSHLSCCDSQDFINCVDKAGYTTVGG